jgi:hypothetical protein
MDPVANPLAPVEAAAGVLSPGAARSLSGAEAVAGVARLSFWFSVLNF